MTSTELLRVAIPFAFLGVAIGLAHFASLRHAVRLYAGGIARSSAVLHQLTRLAAIVLAWLAIAHFGRATGLLAALAGFLIVRPIATARERRASP